MLKNLLISSVFLFLTFSAKAQNDSLAFDEVLSFHPFHFVNNGIRIDYDRHLGKGHWLQIGPQFYVAERSVDQYDDLREFKDLLGVGVSIYHRIYVGKEKPLKGTYFSYGFTYNHFNLKYDNTTTKEEEETEINKFGGDIVIGYQTMFMDKLVVDFYAGLGGRYADLRYRGDTHKKFNDFIYDYGFTGNVIIMGVRIGFGF
jgi:hypothetical protein